MPMLVLHVCIGIPTCWAGSHIDESKYRIPKPHIITPRTSIHAKDGCYCMDAFNVYVQEYIALGVCISRPAAH